MRFATTSISPNARLPLHARPVSYLSLVLAGSYTERVGHTAIGCRPLSLRFHPAGEEHWHQFGKLGGECLNLELDESWSESIRRIAAVKRPVHVSSAGAAGLKAVALSREQQRFDTVMADSLVAELLVLCEAQAGLQRAAASSACVGRAVEVIEAHLPEPLSLCLIAAAVGLHPTHFARSFKRATGLTVGDYVRKRRREQSEQLLLENPSASISRVAAEAGFADNAHMTRTFRADLGVTPTTYRDLLLSGQLSMANPERSDHDSRPIERGFQSGGK